MERENLGPAFTNGHLFDETNLRLNCILINLGLDVGFNVKISLIKPLRVLI